VEVYLGDDDDFVKWSNLLRKTEIRSKVWQRGFRKKQHDNQNTKIGSLLSDVTQNDILN
jgi:hypothetical protein